MMSQDSSPANPSDREPSPRRQAPGLDELPEIPPPQNAPAPRAPGRLDKVGKHLRGVGLVSSVGLILVVSIVIGYAVGRGFDAWLGTEPAGVAIGVILGSAAGFVELFRIAGKAIREQK